MYLNKAMIYGNLTRDPELRALPSGQNVCSFSVATNRTYKDRDGKKQEQTDFHNVVAFGRTADNVAQYKAGKEKAFNALVGQVMKASKGKANPQQVNELLKSKL